MVKLKQFNYKFDKGPLLLKELKKEDFEEGNCRLAIQYYFYKVHALYLKPELVLNPKGYQKLGKFIINEKEFTKDSLKELKEGDIIYADRIRDKEDIKLSKKDWIIRLHSAIYVGDNKVWHSSIVAKKSGYWSFDKFIKYYKPIAAKRVLINH
jgi:hypothetical protein